MRRVLILLVVLAACAPGVDNLAVVASTPGTLGVGHQRLLVALVDQSDGTFLASPDVSTEFELTPPSGESFKVTANFVWAIEGVRGLYEAQVDLPQPGKWMVALHPEGMPSTPASGFDVLADPSVPEVGEQAPPSKTRTTADNALADITTDLEPDPDFYLLSIDQAIGRGTPAVIVFATPGFCTSATCGPTLDRVKEVKKDHPGANYVHVEVYENLDATNFEDLRPVPAVEEWGLPSEPWVFVIDGDGIVSARLEGAFSNDDLAAELVAVGA